MRLFIRLLTLVVLIFSIEAIHGQRRNDPNDTIIKTNLRALQKMMDNYHCCPRTLDDQYYKDIVKLFLKNMDPLRIYFTREDVKQLSDLALLKEQFQGVNQAYTNQAVSIYRNRLKQADASASEIIRTPFDFSLDEKIYFEEDSDDYAANELELRKRMYDLLKFTTLDRLIQEVMDDSSKSSIPLSTREPVEREVSGKIRHRRIKHRMQPRWGFENYVLMLLEDALVKANDPHSDFTPELVDRRNSRMAFGNAFSFGLRLKENHKGDVVVSSLVPGSSAWKSGAINKDDLLLSIQWEDQTPVDLEGANLDEVEQLFAEKRYRKLRLKIRKADGTVSSVTLTRGRFYEDDNHVESFILDGPEKIGYIILPSFYGDWESVYGSSCSRDISKSLERLQFEVNALILDMRYNGGGSLQEANQLAGLFIDEGPLGFRKQRGGFSKEMKDPATGVLYQGPMVVLVNNESASATEYVAAALQDYNRAIIVGSPTFGKATAQRILPADTTIDRVDMDRRDYESEVLDRVKITVAKLYRVTGLNNQLIGVQPDILLPDLSDSTGYHERLMPHALSHDTLKRNGIFEPFSPLPISILREKSAQRVKASAGFNLVERGRALFAEKEKIEDKPLPMRYDIFLELSRKYIAEGRKIAKAIKEDSTAVYKVKNWSVGTPDPREKPDLIEMEINENLRKHISKDIYVHEAYDILKDYMNYKKK